MATRCGSATGTARITGMVRARIGSAAPFPRMAETSSASSGTWGSNRRVRAGIRPRCPIPASWSRAAAGSCFTMATASGKPESAAPFGRTSAPPSHLGRALARRADVIELVDLPDHDVLEIRRHQFDRTMMDDIVAGQHSVKINAFDWRRLLVHLLVEEQQQR